MKTILLNLIFACFIMSSYAQSCDSSLPVSEDFDDSSVIGVCWNLIDSDGDGKNWYWRDYGISNGGYKCLTSRSFSSSSGDLDPDNWIYSHAIDLTTFNTSDDIYVNYKVRAEHPSFAHEYYTIYASTGNQISDFESSPVSRGEFADEVGGTGVFVNRSLDVSSLAGNMIYIAFRHENIAGSQFILNIDDVVISNALLNSDEHFEANSFKHYFNSDTDILTIDSSTLPIDNIQIFNVLGKSVLYKSSMNTKETLDLSTFKDGIYILQIGINQTTKTIKFLKH